jgi:hypothetical protein
MKSLVDRNMSPLWVPFLEEAGVDPEFGTLLGSLPGFQAAKAYWAATARGAYGSRSGLDAPLRSRLRWGSGAGVGWQAAATVATGIRAASALPWNHGCIRTP